MIFLAVETRDWKQTLKTFTLVIMIFRLSIIHCVKKPRYSVEGIFGTCYKLKVAVHAVY